ncbi:LysR substrate-binding domain-containing protein [Halomonas sp. LY9]
MQLEEKVSPIITREVMNNNADIGVCAQMLHGYDLIEFPYHVDDLVLVVPQQHPLAQLEKVFFRECLDYPHVGLHTASAINLEIMRAASMANKTLRIRIQVTSYDALCLMVQAGLGVGVLPRGAIRQYVDGLNVNVLSIQDEWARRKLSIYVKDLDRLSMAARVLVEHFIQAASGASSPS